MNNVLRRREKQKRQCNYIDQSDVTPIFLSSTVANDLTSRAQPIDNYSTGKV